MKSSVSPVNDGLPRDDVAQEKQLVCRVGQVSLHPRGRKGVLKCLGYHTLDLSVVWRTTSQSLVVATLSYPPEVKEKCPERENQQILGN